MLQDCHFCINERKVRDEMKSFAAVDPGSTKDLTIANQPAATSLPDASEASQESCLARSVWTGHRDDLARIDRQADIVQCGSVAKLPGQVFGQHEDAVDG